MWAGSRYLVQAFISLLHKDLRLLRDPVGTIRKFLQEFQMVLNCHRERAFLLRTQRHLTSWLPIAVPFKSWLLLPPPMGFPPAVAGPLGLFPFFFKFYDMLGGFVSPPSHIMTPSRARRKFPQLAYKDIKYCSVFYEGLHDDARTNLAIAQSAAAEGALMLNYMDVATLLRDAKGRVIGAELRDAAQEGGVAHRIYAKTTLLCGGPFTDTLRWLENPAAKKVVNGASGIHIVLPAYATPRGIGLVDMETSDGRFLFYLPWQGHTLIGTTDTRCERPTMNPRPAESEIVWLLQEARKYLSKDLLLRREDVLSAWCGVRPLAADPHANGGSGSRDHVISHNPVTDTVFVAGGKWTTYREMAQEAVDKVVSIGVFENRRLRKCSTLSKQLYGAAGYSANLSIRLIQEYNIDSEVAMRLAQAYGGRAHEVLRVASERAGGLQRIASGFPYIEAEVRYGIRFEWAEKPADVLARRTRLAFLNRDAAVGALPRVLQIFQEELGWTEETARVEKKLFFEFIDQFGGPVPQKD